MVVISVKTIRGTYCKFHSPIHFKKGQHFPPIEIYVCDTFMRFMRKHLVVQIIPIILEISPFSILLKSKWNRELPSHTVIQTLV